MEMILAPSMLSANFAHLEEDFRLAMQPGVKYLHVDVMDGAFVPNISFGPPVISCVRRILPDAVLDVHMMVQEPARYIEDYKACGADIISIHVEAAKDPKAALEAIRSAGLKCSAAINPETPVSVLEPLIPICDMVVVMSVHPGYGGQSLIPECLDKIRELVSLREKLGLSYDIEIDGGVKLSNLDEVLDSGVNVIVAGSAVFGGDIAGNVKSFLEHMEIR